MKAEELKKISEDNYSKITESFFEDFKAKAKNGKTYITYPAYFITKRQIKEIKKLGYKVKYSLIYNEYRISWE